MASRRRDGLFPAISYLSCTGLYLAIRLGRLHACAPLHRHQGKRPASYSWICIMTCSFSVLLDMYIIITYVRAASNWERLGPYEPNFWSRCEQKATLDITATTSDTDRSNKKKGLSFVLSYRVRWVCARVCVYICLRVLFECLSMCVSLRIIRKRGGP